MFGIPEFIITDNGKIARSNDFKQFLGNYGVTPIFNVHYHAQNNPCK